MFPGLWDTGPPSHTGDQMAMASDTTALHAANYEAMQTEIITSDSSFSQPQPSESMVPDDAAAAAVINNSLVRVVHQDSHHPWYNPDIYRRSLRQHEFRLLKLEMGTDDRICISLQEYTSFSTCPQYEAITWCWGDRKKKRSVHVDDFDADTEITQNCHQMLMTLRRQQPQRYLWIDQICINQNDDTEKQQQLSIAGHIYHSASQVIAYTSAVDAVSLALFKTLRYPMPGQDSKPLLGTFMLRNWFRRSWVIQEVLLARNLVIQAGIDTVSWDKLNAAYVEHNFQNKVPVFDRIPSKPNLVELRLWYHSQKHKQGTLESVVVERDMRHPLPSVGVLSYSQLYHLLDQTWHYECRDLKDKLHSKLSLFDGPIPRELGDVYQKSDKEISLALAAYTRTNCGGRPFFMIAEQNYPTPSPSPYRPIQTGMYSNRFRMTNSVKKWVEQHF